MKMCRKCKIEKPPNEFSKNRTRKDGLGNWCKECDKANPARAARARERMQKWREANPQWNKDNNRRWRLANLDKVKVDLHRWYEENKEKAKANRRFWYKNNRARQRATCVAWEKKRRATDPAFRLMKNHRRRVSMALNGLPKPGRTLKNLGCTLVFLKAHIESMWYPHSGTGEIMTWDNYGTRWHADHRFPLSRVNWSDIDQAKMAMHWTNLQPMWAEENMSKGNRLPENMSIHL